jgi:hypothetical protein
MLTMVGLGPPEREEPIVAGMTAYLEEEPPPSGEQRTLVGFPAAPAASDDEAEEPAETPNDAITGVVSYDEITVVAQRTALLEPEASAEATAPAQPEALAEPEALEEPEAFVEPEPLEEAETFAEPEAPAESRRSDLFDHLPPPRVRAPSLPPSSMAPRSLSPSRASLEELEEGSESELKIFPPSLDSLVPPSSKFRIPMLSSPTASMTTSDAPWFMTVGDDAPKSSHFSGAWRIAALALAAAAAVVLGVFAWRPSTGHVLVTVGGLEDAAVTGAVVYVDGERACAPAPCRVTVPKGSHVISVGAPSYRRAAEKALAVGRGTEEALHFILLPDDRKAVKTPVPAPAPVPQAAEVEPAPSAEVVSVRDLRVKSSTDKTSLGVPAAPAPVAAAPAPVLADAVDLDRSPGEAVGSTVTLSISSSPPCNVVLDGRPLGRTPHEVSVSPGAHSVVFIHPEKGRKALRVQTTPGKTAVASVTF